MDSGSRNGMERSDLRDISGELTGRYRRGEWRLTVPVVRRDISLGGA